MKREEDKRIDKLSKKIFRKIGQTIREHNLIDENDRILLGLSGGKDSMILLESLVNRKRAFHFQFDLKVAHILPENTGYSVNLEYIAEYCRTNGLDLLTRKIKPDLSGKQKAPCFVCSWYRRKALFDLSRELDCNKLAFGHHRDDALQTFLINMVYHGSISSIPYTLSMFGGRLELIRPMLDVWEKDLREIAYYKTYKTVQKSCPYEKNTKRNYAAELIDLIEKNYPKAKINMFNALDNIYEEYLPSIKKRLK